MSYLSKCFQSLYSYCNDSNIKIIYDDDNTPKLSESPYFCQELKMIHLLNKEETFENLRIFVHECSHATVLQTKRNADDYSVEEIVAERTCYDILKSIGIYNDTMLKEEYKAMFKNVGYISFWVHQAIKEKKSNTSDIIHLTDSTVKDAFNVLIKYFNVGE